VGGGRAFIDYDNDGLLDLYVRQLGKADANSLIEFLRDVRLT
jgi:hypothetical protein